MGRYGLLALLLTVFCGFALAKQEMAAAADDSLAGQRYVLTRVNGKQLLTPRKVVLEFGPDLRLTGQVCNRFHGQAELKRGILTVPGIASTRMMCPDENLARLENDLLQALRSGVGMLRFGDNLELRRDDMVWEFIVGTGAEEPAPEATASEANASEADTDAADGAESAVSEEPPVASLPDTNAVEERQLVGRKFILSSINGKEFSTQMGRQPFVEFSRPEEGLRINGSACNNFMGMAILENGMLTVKNAASTMMLCPDDMLSDFEQVFHQALRAGFGLSLDGGKLTLRGDGVVLVYNEE